MTEFSVDPEVINRYVAEKIVESSLGDALKDVIDSEVKRISTKFDNPIKPAIAGAISRIIAEYIDTPEIREQLKAAVEANLTDDILSELISQVVSQRFQR